MVLPAYSHHRSNPRPSSRALCQEGVPVLVSSPSPPWWHGVGTLASQSVRCGARHPAERTRWTRGRGLNAKSCSSRSNGESWIPVVPSDHDLCKAYRRSPLASSCKPLTRYGTSGCIPHHTLSLITPMRRNPRIGVPGKAMYTGTAGSFGFRAFPASPKPEPMRRTFCPARSPKARRCVTKAVMVWASAGVLSSSESSPVATAGLMPTVKYLSRRRLRMTRRLMLSCGATSFLERGVLGRIGVKNTYQFL